MSGSFAKKAIQYGRFKSHSVLPDDANRRYAACYLQLAEGSYWEAEPYLSGTTKFIIIFEGHIEVSTNGERFTVGKETQFSI